MERYITIGVGLMLAALLAGCANQNSVLGNGANVTTSSVAPVPPVQMAAPKVDPACISLTAKIDTLRKDGVAERIEKISTGKTAKVSVKRDALAKMTELDKANAEFQAKCSTLSPRSASMAPMASPGVSVAPVAALAPAADAAKGAGQTAVNTTAGSVKVPAAAQ